MSLQVCGQDDCFTESWCLSLNRGRSIPLTGFQMIAQLRQANKIYPTPTGPFTALDKTTLDVNESELLLIIGPSGSGKTTLLSLIGCLIEPTEGNQQSMPGQINH